MRDRSPKLVAVLACAALLTSAGVGSADEINVEATVDRGTRSFSLKGLSGGPLGSIALGAGGSAGFVANVTDARYSRVGYQVSASLSDLYKVAGSSYDCSKKIAASSFAIGFLTSPTAISDIAAVVEPVWDLTGTLTGTVATTLGVASGTVVTVANVAGERVERTLGGAFKGIEDVLPIKVAPGSGGAFTAPAPHAGCAPTPTATPTSRLLMQGTGSDLAALFAWIEDAVAEAADAGGDGIVTADELAAGSAVDDAVLTAAVRGSLASAGVDLPTLDTLIASGTLTMSEILVQLSATLEPLLSLVGQTGTYLASPKLTATIANGVSPGTYRGTMTVTQVDVP